MDKKEILIDIIKSHGDCYWLRDLYNNIDVCSTCPLNQMKSKEGGSYYSCYQALCGEAKLSEHEVHANYMKAAKVALRGLVAQEKVATSPT